MMYFDKTRAAETRGLVFHYMQNFLGWKEETEEFLKRKLEESFLESTINYSEEAGAEPGLFHS
jgi:hypothetical protein